MTDPGRARSQRLRRKPKPGWCRWRATKPRITAIRTSCGRRVCWRAMRASMARRRDTDVSPTLSKARYARFSVKRKSNPQGALLSGTPRCRVRAEDGGGSVRLSRGPGPEKGRGQGEENVEQTAQAGSDRLLRREAGNPGDRDHIAGFAAGARHLRDILARS